MRAFKILNFLHYLQWNFIPRHILPPLLANTLIGTVLYTTYIATLPVFHPPSAFQLHRPFPPPPYTSVFMAGKSDND